MIDKYGAFMYYSVNRVGVFHKVHSVPGIFTYDEHGQNQKEKKEKGKESKMKKLFAFILVAAMALSLCACGSGSSPAPASGGSEGTTSPPPVTSLDLSTSDQAVNEVKSDETLTVVLAGEASTLIGESGSNNQTTHITELLMDTLVQFDTVTGELLPGLMESWEWLDPQTLRAHLRHGVICYDGTEFIAEDVMFSIQKSAEWSSRGYGVYFDIPACVIEDDHTLLLKFVQTDPGLLEALSLENAGMLDKSSFEANGGDEGNRTKPLYGTGPYRFVEWVPGQYILLERNENYWNTEYVAYYKFIKFTFVSDTATRIMAVQSGDADVALDVGLGQAIELRGSPTADLYALDAEQCVGIWMNVGNPDSPLNDIRVREAIRLAIDVEAVNKVFTGGIASIQYHTVKTVSRYYTDPTDGVGYPQVDLERAQALLAEAGYPGGGFTLRAPIQAEHEDLITAVQAMLSQIGINVEITIPDTGTLVTALISGDYDLCVARHESYSYFRSHSQFYVYEPNMNDSYLTGPKVRDPEMAAELQGYIDTAYSTLDEEVAAEAMANIQKFIYDNCLYVGICSDICSGVCRPDLVGFRVYPHEHVDLRFVHPAG